MKLTVVCEAWKTYRKNTLKGFATIKLVELDLSISDIGLHTSHGKAWAALPSKARVKDGRHVSEAGKFAYDNIFKFGREEVRRAFSDRVVEAVARFDPHALADDGGVT
jgi:hypothetical protein